MLKHFFLLMTLVLAFVSSAMGQTRQSKGFESKEFEQSQSRIIEPKLDVFIMPLVADVEILENEQRQDYGPYEYEVQAGVETLTFDVIDNFKARASYRAAREAGADVIVAATFNTYAHKLKDKILYIEVSGFPGKYKNFRSAIHKDSVAKYENYQWIPTIYKHVDLIEEVNKTKAIKGK